MARNQNTKSSKPKSKAPVFIAYHVAEKPDAMPDDKPYWARIGAAWDHEDGKGLSLEIDMLPIGFDGRIVLRTPKPPEDPGEGA